MSKKISEFFHRFLIGPVMEQIKQGANAEGLAQSLAAAATIAVIPILGATTALCVMVGLRWRLNQPVMQAVNYLLYPLQIILLPVFLYAGALLFGVDPVSFDPKTVFSEFTSEPTLFMSKYGMAGLRACLVWFLVAPLLFFPLKSVSRGLFKRLMKNQEAKI
jgi:uncharacterized protein (DUF2062 family)